MDELFSSLEISDFPVALHLAMNQDPVRMEAHADAIKAVVLAPNDLLGQESVFGQSPFIAHPLQQTAGTGGIVFNENAACMIRPGKDLVKTRKLKRRGFAQEASA